MKKAKDIVVNSIDKWPTDWTKERLFLKDQLDWIQPEILGGITSQGQAKPDFQMYYDAKDTTSPRNDVAKRVASLFPEYEVRKVEGPKNGIFRGPCILVYSPMMSSMFGDDEEHGGGAFQTHVVPQSRPGKRRSLDQMQQVLFFQTTAEATRMYQEHDNPMHRMFGSSNVGPN